MLWKNYHGCFYNGFTIINYRPDKPAPLDNQFTYHKTLETEAVKDVVFICYQLPLKLMFIRFTFVVDLMRICMEKHLEYIQA